MRGPTPITLSGQLLHQRMLGLEGLLGIERRRLGAATLALSASTESGGAGGRQNAGTWPIPLPFEGATL